MNVAAVVPAAGRGDRLGAGIPKSFVSVAGRPLLIHTLKALFGAFPFRQAVVAVGPSEVDRARRLLGKHGFGRRVRVVPGGSTRAASVRNAVRVLADPCDWVLIHDAARPLVSRALVRRTLEVARRTGAAIAALPATATVKRIRDGRTIVRTEDREALVLAQTPQVFRRELLLGRYRRLGGRALRATDEAALFDGSRVRVAVVPGEARNLKVTTPEDLGLFRHWRGV